MDGFSRDRPEIFLIQGPVAGLPWQAYKGHGLPDAGAGFTMHDPNRVHVTGCSGMVARGSSGNALHVLVDPMPMV